MLRDRAREVLTGCWNTRPNPTSSSGFGTRPMATGSRCRHRPLDRLCRCPVWNACSVDQSFPVRGTGVDVPVCKVWSRGRNSRGLSAPYTDIGGQHVSESVGRLTWPGFHTPEQPVIPALSSGWDEVRLGTFWVPWSCLGLTLRVFALRAIFGLGDGPWRWHAPSWTSFCLQVLPARPSCVSPWSCAAPGDSRLLAALVV